jgi:ribosomal protein L40E
MTPTHCANCECENPPGAKFCNACGAQLQRLACPSCGAGNEVGATTCRQCQAALPEGETRTVAVSSIETNARIVDTEFDAALQALRERLPMIGAEYAEGPAEYRGHVPAPADELPPEVRATALTDPSTFYPTTDIADRSGRPGPRAGRMRTTAVVFGTAALAAAGVAALYTVDHRERTDASPALFTAGELSGSANSPAGARPASTDATGNAPINAAPPQVTHGIAKSATPVAAAATKAGPSEGGAPRPNPSVAQREARVTSVAPAGDPPPRVTHGVAKRAAPAAAAPADPGPSQRAAPRPDPPAAVRESRVTSAAPAGDSLPRVTHGVAKRAAPAAATAAVPREGAALQPGATTAQREDRAPAVAPAAGVSAPPRTGEGGTGIERPPPARIGPCTEALATLGLCNPEPTQRRE